MGTPSLPQTPKFLALRSLPLNLATLAAITYSGLYITLEPFAGLAVTPLIMGGAALANKATAKWGGKATALLDNLVQALFLAPLFVWMEVLFKLGYRPELRKRLEEGVRKELRRLAVAKEEKRLRDAEANAGEKKGEM